jgi:hypothetical protein
MHLTGQICHLGSECIMWLSPRLIDTERDGDHSQTNYPRHFCLDRVEYNRVDLLRYITLSLHHGWTQWRSWLRHCATSRKVAGSFPDGVIDPGIDSLSNRIEYLVGGGKCSRCVGLTTLLTTV